MIIEAAATAGAKYVVVLRAHSAARFLPDEGFAINVRAPRLGLEEAVQVRAFTRWVGEGNQAMPRELVVEIRGRAGSLDEATGKFAALARPVATMAGFVANVRVGLLEVHLGYDSSPEAVERELLEVFVADERGGVTEGRRIRLHLMEAACTAFMGLTVDWSRIDRALRQYELGLREWYLGGEWLAMSHLWIAAENLTKAVIRKTCLEKGVSEEDLAHSYSVVTDDPERPRWRDALGVQIRQQMIFEADVPTYQSAKKASDGLEHGFLELDEIRAQVLKAADKTFHYIRRTIIALLGVSDEVAEELLSIKPMDVQSTRKVVRGRLTGAAEDPAAEGELYPILEWNSAVVSLERQEGGDYRRSDEERFTVRAHPNLGFQLDRLEYVGRLKDGEALTELSPQDVKVEYAPARSAPKMLGAVMRLVDAVASESTVLYGNWPMVLAFYLYGQGVASFQAAKTLIEAHLPVEALPSLRALTIVAARFEQIRDPKGPGLGIVARMALDALDEPDVERDYAARRRLEMEAGFASAGLTVPTELPTVEPTLIYHSLTAEMSLARSAANATYGAAGLHILSEPSDEQIGFRTRLEPGPLTDMVSSACVIAALELLKGATALFDWTVDGEEVDRLLADARQLNEESAQAKLTP